MSWLLIIFTFIVSCFLLAWLGSHLIKSLIKVAQYLRWKEFIITFFILAFATSLPNLFVGVNAALQNKPELSLGDILGGSLADLTLVLAIAVFFSKKGLVARSETIQKSAIFTAVIAILPLILIFDLTLSRIDGVILIAAFFIYAFWIFSKKSRFAKIYPSDLKNIAGNFKDFLISLFKIIIILTLLLIISHFVIILAQFFADELNISLALVGVLIVGLGNVLPETYVAIVSARKNEDGIVLGELMGSVIICATLVLGIVALINPFQIINFSPFLVARVFLIVAALMSLFFIKSDKRITKKEGLYLLLIYIIFLITEIFLRNR